VTELFDGTGIELVFEREAVTQVPFDSTEDAVEFMTTKFGPLIMARQLLEVSGRWNELRATLVGLYERGDAYEYLVVLGRKERS
jgi:hypothetical protein